MNTELIIDDQVYTGIYLNMTMHASPANNIQEGVHTFNLAMDPLPQMPPNKIGYLKIDDGRAFSGNVKIIDEIPGEVVSVELAGKPDSIDMHYLKSDCADGEIGRACSIFEL